MQRIEITMATDFAIVNDMSVTDSVANGFHIHKTNLWMRGFSGLTSNSFDDLWIFLPNNICFDSLSPTILPCQFLSCSQIRSRQSFTISDQYGWTVGINRQTHIKFDDSPCFTLHITHLLYL